MKEIQIWDFIQREISKNHPVILIAVVAHDKGSPGKTGFKMAISRQGKLIGSIGGGVMEYRIVKESLKTLKTNKPFLKIEKLYHNKNTSHLQSGLICAGTQTNFTMLLNRKYLKTIETIQKSVRNQTGDKIIFSKKGISLKGAGIYTQKIGIKDRAIIIGGGHVGLAVSRVMSMLDFHVTVIDSRRDLQTMKENNFADRKIISPYPKLGKLIPKNGNNYIVIVTTGFDSDKEALKQVIGKNSKYIGLMGTKTKINKIFEESIKDGISPHLLKKIRAPIGIDIGSDTPEEIAISIAAEIIHTKRSAAQNRS